MAGSGGYEQASRVGPCPKGRFRLCAASRLRALKASPLILLAKVGRLTLLPKLTEEPRHSDARTLGVIVAAKVRGLIPAARPVCDAVVQAGLLIRPAVLRDALKLLDE